MKNNKVMWISLISALVIAIIMATAATVTVGILLLPCKHEWVNATCTVAKTCSKCQETEGEPLNHTWNDATCDTPKTCSVCQATEGEPLAHIWDEATCQNPKTCSLCQTTEGEPLKHSWKAATCKKPQTCKSCGETKGKKLGHDWQQATCQRPKTCSVCGKTEGSASGHYYVPDPSFGGNFNMCAYCHESEPNVICPVCSWSTFTTGIAATGLYCPDCGYKVVG